MAVSKVIYSGTILVDLTVDTVTASTLMAGTTAHGKNGEKVTGTLFSGFPDTVILPISDILQDSSGMVIQDSSGRNIEDIKRYKRI